MKSINSDFFKRYINIIILQFVVVAIFIITVTAIRFISGDFFAQLKTVYEEYVMVDTDISLVLDGEKE